MLLITVDCYLAAISYIYNICNHIVIDYSLQVITLSKLPILVRHSSTDLQSNCCTVIVYVF